MNKFDFLEKYPLINEYVIPLIKSRAFKSEVINWKKKIPFHFFMDSECNNFLGTSKIELYFKFHREVMSYLYCYEFNKYIFK